MPRREDYQGQSNGIEQEFAYQNMDRDMKDAYEASTRTGPDEHVRNLRAMNRALLFLLAAVVAGLGLAIGFY